MVRDEVTFVSIETLGRLFLIASIELALLCCVRTRKDPSELEDVEGASHRPYSLTAEANCGVRNWDCVLANVGSVTGGWVRFWSEIGL